MLNHSRQLALEANLQDNWNLEALEVYADLMQEMGHPWGELCALDLHATSETAQRRLEILAAWLGEELADHVSSLVRYGFVFELKSGDLADAIFDSPLADYVWAYEIVVLNNSATEELRRLAEKPRRWLERLVVSSPYALTSDYKCGVRLSDRLAKAIPHLKHLSCPARFSFSGDRLADAQACVVGEIDLSSLDETTKSRSREIARHSQLDRVLELASDCSWSSLVRDHAHLAPDLGLPTLLLHLHNAKLLRLNGPLLERTNIGQSWLRPPSFVKQPVVVPGFVSGRYEVVIEPQDYDRASESLSRLFYFDRMVNHISCVMQGIENLAAFLDEATFIALRSYLALLDKVWNAEGRPFRLSRNMIDALATLSSVNRLAKYGLDIETVDEYAWELPPLLHFCEVNWHRSLVIRLDWD